MPPLEQLTLATRNKLRSGQILTTLIQLVSELVQNSLDANAHHIEVGVNCEEWECWVRDDGSGISKNGLLALSGGPDQGRYNTSKTYSTSSLGQFDTFGFRGEALASAANISCIEIASRTSSSRESWSIILKSGETIYNGPSLRWRRESPGTVVFVRDAFFNLPIRRLSHPPVHRTLELIRKEIEAFALVFPRVSFTLDNNHNRSSSTRSDRARLLSIPKTNSTLTTFRHLYGRTVAEHAEEIREEQGSVKIEGFISLDGWTSKTYQFLFLNRHPLSTCEFHRIIEHKFTSSSFSRHAFDEYGDPSQPPSAIRRSPRKGEKKPVYVLNITLPVSQIDNCVEPAKSAVFIKDSVPLASFLGTVIQRFLVKHGFSSDLTKSKRAKALSSPPTSKSKRRKVEQTTSVRNCIPTTTNRVSEVSLMVLLDQKNSESTIWTDPRTGMKFVVDQRTGNSYPYGCRLAEESSHDEIPKSSHMKRTLQSTGNTLETPDWIRNALDINQAYKSIESLIPSLSLSSSLETLPGRWALPPSSQMAGSSQVARLDKGHLRAARVLGQVDRKFIACVVDPDSSENSLDKDTTLGSSLLLVDQHAADERVRVERFQRDLCTGFLRSETEQRKLQPPVAVLLTAREVEQITSSTDLLDIMKRWGFTFSNNTTGCSTINVANPKADYLQVLVDGIPELLANKLLMENELRDVLKSFVHIAAEERDISLASFESASVSDELPWQAAMRWCPKALLDLLDSKACRGAVMFNDSLNPEQCERLILRLSECTLPFQCAHGRPSLVPLTRLEGRPSAINSESQYCGTIDWRNFVSEV